jgi:hypothetical protein
MPESDLAVIVERIKGLETLFNVRFDDNKEEHQEIITHQKETNGNVRKNTDYRKYATGAIAVLTAMVLPLLFIVVKKII